LRLAAWTSAPRQAAPALAESVSSRETEAIDLECRDWIRELGDEATRDDAISLLRVLLLRASRFEVARRRGDLAQGEVDQIAHASAAEALRQVLARLDEYRGRSRFTTWASKFALLEAAVRMRKLGWQARQCPAEDHSLALSDTRLPPELRSRFAKTIRDGLTPQQRDVFLTISFTAMPIDVLADQLGGARADVYETLRAARRLLRERLVEDA
jgi:RNA polymerase sigma-70 factor, ECF subfamily